MLKEIILMLGITFVAMYYYVAAPPQTVQKTFKEKFCGAQNVKWTKDKDAHWEASFIYKEAKLSASFCKKGDWIKTEEAIPAEWFPAPVSGAIANEFSGWNITEANKVETAKNGLVFCANIKSGGQEREVVFRKDGSPVFE